MHVETPVRRVAQPLYSNPVLVVCFPLKQLPGPLNNSTLRCVFLKEAKTALRLLLRLSTVWLCRVRQHGGGSDKRLLKSAVLKSLNPPRRTEKSALSA